MEPSNEHRAPVHDIPTGQEIEALTVSPFDREKELVIRLYEEGRLSAADAVRASMILAMAETMIATDSDPQTVARIFDRPAGPDIA